MKRTRLSRFQRTPKGKSKTKEINKKLFSQTFPIVGEVPIAFYIPECASRELYKKKIEKYGGIVINTFEPYMFQIRIERNRVSNKNFYEGVIYSSKLIDRAIERGKMIKTLNTFKIGLIENGIPHK